MADNKHSDDDILEQRRECLCKLTKFVGAAGIVAAAWPLVSALGPDENIQGENEPIDISLSGIGVGQTLRRVWQGKVILIRHRTPEEMVAARNADLTHFIHPQPDNERVSADYPQWLIVEGYCPHAGCVPNARTEGQGWVCPCHGSEFDSAGRVIRGPATANLAIPDYVFHSSGQTVRIGTKDA